MLKKTFPIYLFIFSSFGAFSQIKSSFKPIKIGATNDYIEVEAEKFSSQQLTENRAWYTMSDKKTKKIKPDPDKKHLKGASNGAYLEVLPETFTEKNRTQYEGINFSKTPGKVAIVNYKVNFKSSGKYYVWVRGYCSNTLDNSVHVGVDNKWYKNGTALYFCDGQDSWRWSSYLRDYSDNCGTSNKRAYIIINRPGTHTVQFSMREDGFEFDKWVLTKDKSMVLK